MLLTALVSSAQDAGVRLIGDSGWRISDPIGFEFVSEKRRGHLLSWRKRWQETLRQGGRSVVRHHEETINLDYGKSFEYHVGVKLRADCGPGKEPAGKPIEGSHHGQPSLSYVCPAPSRDSSPTHKYYVVLQKNAETTGEGELWTRIELSYQYQWDQPALLPPKDKIPHLESFRIMQGTLGPI